MAAIRTFEEIIAWQKARILADEVYKRSLEGSFAKDYPLRDQINRSSGSIMDNIAEGFERGGQKEFIQYLSYAKGSSGEVRSQLYRAKDRGYIDESDYIKLSETTVEIGKQIGALIRYLNQSDIKGPKFKNRKP
jgi:four helix bundle protein